MSEESSPGLLPQTFIAIDTETTGLSPVGDRVVEVAALSFRANGEEGESFERLVDPGIPIPPALTAIHGITDEMVAGQPPLERVLPEFLEFIGGSVLVAHNAPYDVAILLVSLTRLSRATRHSDQGVAPRARGNLVLDTCTLARACFPGAANYRLSTIAEMLGVPRGRAHRAMPDVRACKDVFVKVLAKAGPGLSLDGLIRLNGYELRFGVDEAMAASLSASGGRIARLIEAMRSAEAVMIEYHGGTKGSDPRLVTPIALMTQDTALHLIAHCHVDGALKNFRLDKVAAVYPPWAPPADGRAVPATSS